MHAAPWSISGGECWRCHVGGRAMNKPVLDYALLCGAISGGGYSGRESHSRRIAASAGRRSSGGAGRKGD